MQLKFIGVWWLMAFLVVPNFVFAQDNKDKKSKKSNEQTVVQTSNNPNAQSLPIRRVILYSNGVAYIERRGIISGKTEINLQFKQSQVDDVLKSMVVLDLGQGRIGAVSYNSSAPPSAKMAEIPFGIGAETDDESSGGLAGVLAQLQGAKVLVTSTKGTATGAILNVEKRKAPVKKDDEETSLPLNYALVIASDAGEISSFDLTDVKSVKLLDGDTVRDVNEFANATASARRRDAKTITVTSEGSGQREMVVSYTIAAPIWKTTYRVVLDNEGKPFFQGWAIVDNVSDEDWTEVKMSMVSGSPISFIQPIQKPLYRYRDINSIPEDLHLSPQIYEITETDGVVEAIPKTGNFSMGKANDDTRIGPAGPAREGSGGAVGKNSGSGITDDDAPKTEETSISDALTSGNSGVETAAKGAELGDLFEYQVEQPITVNRDRSALIPIVQTKMDGERVSIYREETRADRPLSGMLLKNTTPLTFEDGAMTVLERDAYAGESLLERLKPQEERLISFAVDLGTLVAVKEISDREPAKLIKAVNGAFQVHYFRTAQKIYTLSNQTDKPKIVFIEHPIRGKWSLSDETKKPDGATANFYRFRLALKPFEKIEFPVTEKQALMDSYTLTNLSYTDLELFVSRRYINEETRQKLNEIVKLRQEINEISTKFSAFEAEEKRIADDQKRLRENIEALTKTPEAKMLITRYIAKANEQETRLETIQKERLTLETQKRNLENELAARIRAFNL